MSRLQMVSPIGDLGDGGELQEIHMKMSKKVAQLTKGIIIVTHTARLHFSSNIWTIKINLNSLK